MSQQKFKRIILFARQHRANHGVNETLNRLVYYLKQNNIEVYQDVNIESGFEIELPTLKRDQMGEARDLMIVIGGDGSLLSAARLAVQVNVPVLGINRGRLGFLTDISPNEIETQLSAVFAGEYTEERRFLLDTHIHDQEHTYFQGEALNDVVLSRGREAQLIEYEVSINQQFVSSYRADGLILATPTGSTAYALSAGGPIMNPSLNAIVMVPMFSHSLNTRPLVIDGNSVIDFHFSQTNEHELQVSCDGHESRIVKPGQVVTVKKNARQLRLLHPKDYHYYDTLRIKLGWGNAPA